MLQDEIVESLRRCAYGDGDASAKKLGRTRTARETRQVGAAFLAVEKGLDSGDAGRK